MYRDPIASSSWMSIRVLPGGDSTREHQSVIDYVNSSSTATDQQRQNVRRPWKAQSWSLARGTIRLFAPYEAAGKARTV